MNEPTTQLQPGSQVPDHDLIRCVGTGSFGEVWLARASATQRYRAIKTVHRQRFASPSAYETEFSGMKKFEEISREHEGFIDILHVTHHDEAGSFSYVMELADDLESGQSIDPKQYTPKTVANELQRRRQADARGVGRLASAECVQVALSITAALSALHQRMLVHRDIKPSNIVFVRGTAKLADVGLVTEAKTQDQDRTLIGSPHFMDAQAHGTVQGDLYGFGKVLYVMATGRDAQDWPVWPQGFEETDDLDTFRELHEICLKACHPNRSQRYQSAEQIHSQLLLLRVGHSIKRLQRLEQAVASLKRFGLFALGMLSLAGLLLYQRVQQGKQEAELRQRKVGSCVAYGVQAMNEKDLLGALPWFAEAFRQDRDNPRTEPAHRLRLGAVLQQCPRILQMWFNDHPAKFAQFAEDNMVLLPATNRQWALCGLDSGLPVYPPFGTGREHETVAINPSMRLAVTADRDDTNGVLRLWDSITGQPIDCLTNETALEKVAISPDGRWVAAVAGTKVLAWDRPARQRVKVLAGHTKLIRTLAFSRDSQRLVTGGNDNTARVWNLAGDGPATRPIEHPGWVYSVAFSPDGRRVATGCSDRYLRVWETDSRRELLPPLLHSDGVWSVEFSAAGDRLVAADLGFVVRVWDAHTGESLLQLRHNSQPQYAAFSPSGRRIITAAWDGTVRVWELPAGSLTPQPIPVVYSGDGARFAVQTNQIIRIVEADGEQVITLLRVAQLPLLIVLNRDGRRLLTLTETSTGASSNVLQAILWNGDTSNPIGKPVLLDRQSTNLVLSPDGYRLLGFAQNHTKVWDFRQNQVIFDMPWLAWRVAFDPSGERLAVVSEETRNQVQIWWLGTTQPLLRSPLAHPPQVRVDSLEWSSDGKMLLTACRHPPFDPEFAQVWDSSSGVPVGAQLRHRDGVRFAAFSPDAQKVVTCSQDFSALLWDTPKGQQHTQPLQHKDQVYYAAFSPDGRRVATASNDGTARVWDTDTGEPLTPALSHPLRVEWVQWVDRGRGLLTKTEDGLTRLWKLAEDQRPAQDLVSIAELLSAEQIHATESAMPQTKDALERLWRDLRTRY